MNKTKTQSKAAYDKQNEGKITLHRTIPFEALKDIVKLMEDDDTPSFEFTATDENTQEEFLISLKIEK